MGGWVGPLSEKSLSSSLSSIHILYNQALVGGLSVSYVPATHIANIQLNGGSISLFNGLHQHTHTNQAPDPAVGLEPRADKDGPATPLTA